MTVSYVIVFYSYDCLYLNDFYITCFDSIHLFLNCPENEGTYIMFVFIFLE